MASPARFLLANISSKRARSRWLSGSLTAVPSWAYQRGFFHHLCRSYLTLPVDVTGRSVSLYGSRNKICLYYGALTEPDYVNPTVSSEERVLDHGDVVALHGLD